MDMRVQKGKENESGMNERRTKLLPHTSRPPIGANMMPVMNSVGRTVLGVSMGCHAFRRCCLKAVSRGIRLRSETEKARVGGARLTCRASPASLFLLAFAVLVVRVVVALLFATE